jgi:hypothetical protein
MQRAAVVVTTLVLTAGALVIARQEYQTQAKPPVSGSRDVTSTGPQAPAGTGAISGTLVAADASRPVRRARVTLSGGDVRTNKSVTTDEGGNFSFTSLPTGDFTLTASKGGYLDATYGQIKLGVGQAGTPIHLLAGQRLTRLSFPIQRGGVITGIITDEFGDPAFGTQVRALRYSWRTGERKLVIAGTGTTDDRGIYRIPSLAPGDYIVSASPRDGLDQVAMVEKMMLEEAFVNARAGATMAVAEEAKMALAARMSALNEAAEPSSGYAPVFYPGTTQSASASTFALGPSEERTGIDIQLQIVPLVTVTGTVTGAQQTAVNIQLIDRSQAVGQNTRTTRSGPDGSFTFTGVAPGQYTVMARASVREGGAEGHSIEMLRGAGAESKAIAVAAALGTDGATQLWAMQDVTVDGRTRTNVALSLQTGMSVSGSVRFEGAPPPTPAQLARLTVTLAPAAGGVGGDLAVPGFALVDAEGRFTIRGVFPGTYRVVPSAGVPGYSLASAVFAGRDTLDFPLEVKPGEDQPGGLLTFGMGSTEISGTLQDTNGAPAPGYTVLIFPSDSRYWIPQSPRIQTARPATNGKFTLRNLRPGEYRLVAVTDVEPGQWFDPALLRQLLSISMPIGLAEGEKKTQDLRIK